MVKVSMDRVLIHEVYGVLHGPVDVVHRVYFPWEDQLVALALDRIRLRATAASCTRCSLRGKAQELLGTHVLPDRA
jgi:hypothetical protein